MSIPHLIQMMQQAYEEEEARDHVAAIARHHRIQASPGFRDAAHWLAGVARQAGLQVTIERYPANATARFWTQPSFQEWRCAAAALDWLHPGGEERLCDFALDPLCLIQRSIAAAGAFEVIDLAAGSAEDYAGVDVAGKLVLSRAPVRQTYQQAVVERGAAGILYDQISGDAPGRNRQTLADARQYASFWWQAEETRAWGFVLTPRQGDRLRAALAAGEKVRLRAQISADFYDGEFETVAAAIPGSASGAVLAIAHLCHPQGFANDNASGAACLLQTAITLQRLIAAGRLPPPQRTILFLWPPEMTGTCAWLQRHENDIPGIVAGVNLDMVGEDQEKTASVWLIERPPEAASSFAPDLLARLRAEILPEHPIAGREERYPLIRHAITGFSGGSDHIVTSDPAVGIPTPMLIQWPDRFYHTTADTLEMVDARALQRSGVLSGSYLYWLASAGPEDAVWLGWEMLAQFEQRLSREVQDEVTRLLTAAGAEQAAGWRRLQARQHYRQQRQNQALATLARLGGADLPWPVWQAAAAEIADRVLDRGRRQLPPLPPAPEPEESAWTARARGVIPVRSYRGPVMDLASPYPPFPLPPADAQTWQQLHATIPGWRLLRLLAEFWADGRRSLAEIAQLIELETGQAVGPALETYFHLLEIPGLIRLEQPTT